MGGVGAPDSGLWGVCCSGSAANFPRLHLNYLHGRVFIAIFFLLGGQAGELSLLNMSVGVAASVGCVSLGLHVIFEDAFPVIACSWGVFNTC